MSGWIKIHRSITEHWLYTEKRTFSKFEAWNDILLTVNYAESKCLIKGKLYTIKRGQSILSLDSWGKRWGWDKSKVRRFMELLKADGMIELVCDNITTQLTVCKYEIYQDERNAKETQAKLKRNTNETQTTLIKEEEEGKEEQKEESNKIPPYPEFLEYALEKQPTVDKQSLKLKYEAWIENGWKDGHDKKIKNWKSKLLQTILHLPKTQTQQTNQITYKNLL
jgi:hypothetical protein